MLQGIARLAIAAPRRVIGVGVLAMILAAIFGIPVVHGLSAGGFQDPTSESARAAALLSKASHQGDMEMLFLVRSRDDVQKGAGRAVGTGVVAQLSRSPYVARVDSPWTTPQPAAAALVSKDHASATIVVGITGDEISAPKRAESLAELVAHDRDGVSVQAGGMATVYAQVNKQTEKDLLRIESIAIPVSFAVLVWVFGGLLAAALPIVVGGFAIVGSLAALRAVTLVTDVSAFALNLTVAIGLALAVDYTLLIVSRYRDEIAAGADRDNALVRTMTTAGRTVLFSAMTVALSMVALVLFPMYALKSFAYAGIAVVAFAGLAAVIVTPAVIVLLGDRLDSFDVRRLVRRLWGRADPAPKPIGESFWYCTAKFAMRHSIPLGLGIIALLLVLGAPFLGVKWGFPNDRVLPPSSSARAVGDTLRSDFTADSEDSLIAVVPDTTGVTPAEMSRYAAQLSRVHDVSSVSSPSGTFVAGARVLPTSGPTEMPGGIALFTVNSAAPPFTPASETQLDRLHAVAGPGGQAVEMTGQAQSNRDSIAGIMSRLPLVLGLISIVTFLLLFLLTGSIVLPVKALALNVLSLTAAFGAMVWIFQDGHLGALGTTPTGTLVVTMPVLLFCITFGLSMDYEVFLISRIREYWLASPRTQADNDESVALGLARTGRVITAAALLMSISFAALISAQVSFMRIFGLGLTLAVLVDATLLRMLLVPAFMHVFGRLNWWAPRPLARLHDQLTMSRFNRFARASNHGQADAPNQQLPTG